MQWEEGTSPLCILLIDTEEPFACFCRVLYLYPVDDIHLKESFTLIPIKKCYRSTFNTLAVLCACVFLCHDVGRLLFVCEGGELLIINGSFPHTGTK